MLLPAIKPGTNASSPALKQIEAGLLSVGYTDVGPADGPAVLLLRGWPYEALMERGFHKPGDVENRLDYHVGQLGA